MLLFRHVSNKDYLVNTLLHKVFDKVTHKVKNKSYLQKFARNSETEYLIIKKSFILTRIK